VTTKVRTSRDRTVGHDGGGNVGLDEHTVRQCGISGLVLLGSQGVQNGSIDSQGDRGSSGGSGRRGSRSNASSGIGILIALGGDASKERTSGSVIGIAISARGTVAPSRLNRRGGTIALPSTSRDFGMDEAAPFTVRARSGNPESLRGHQVAVTD
jgi:hypothetical protein